MIEFYMITLQNFITYIKCSLSKLPHNFTKLCFDNMKISLLFVVLFVAATSVVNSKRKVKYDWNNYYSHKNINGFIDSVAREKKWIKTKSIGKTFEKRDMRVIEIKKAGRNAPIAWIEAGIHAR